MGLLVMTGWASRDDKHKVRSAFFSTRDLVGFIQVSDAEGMSFTSGIQ